MATIHDFYLFANGKAFDIDGAFGAQCWDGYAEYCNWLGVPYANCRLTGYACDIWNDRNNNGSSQYFDFIASPNVLKDGDIVIWQICPDYPSSHIAIFRKYNDNAKQTAVILGQNQASAGANGMGSAFSQNVLTLRGFAGALRPKKLQVSKPAEVKPKPDYRIGYRAHVQNIGWQDQIGTDGGGAGTTGKGLRLEALQINPVGFNVKMEAHVQNKGWITGKNNTVGTIGESLRIEAFRFTPSGLAKGEKLMAQAHLEGTGWTDWTVCDGVATIGTVGQSKRLEAIRLKVVKA